MRHTPRLLCWTLTASLLMAATGCSFFQGLLGLSDKKPDKNTALAQDEQDQAARLANALAQSTKKSPDIHWVDQDAPHHLPPLQPATAPAPDKPAAEASAGGASPRTAANSPLGDARLSLADRRKLVADLLDAVRRSNDNPTLKALYASFLDRMMGQAEMDPQDLEPLSPNDRARVQRYHELTALIDQAMLSPGAAANMNAIFDDLDGLLDGTALHIKQAQLCRSVTGYGVYEPIESNTFLAGRPQPLIIYAEIDHFHVAKTGASQYEAKLAQEVVLYNEADGLAVWREPKVEIVDDSRNRRRDFFVVQRVELPARLTVGKYLLKITLTDTQGGSIDETTLPIQVVADEGLVKAGGK